MRADTDAHHEHVVQIGRALRFDTVREWSPPDLDADYVPRIDVLWRHHLSNAQIWALESVGASLPRGGALPIAAWEVEGSDQSTKGFGSDLANMRVTEAPFCFLAAHGGTKDNLYDRARRAVRTHRHFFGCQAAVPLDTRWLSDLATLRLSSAAVPARAGKPVRAGGGEGAWADEVRAILREQGTKAGFEVAESLPSPLSQKDDFTRHQIDLVWMLPMLALAKLRAIEHRVGVVIFTGTVREVLKTNRYKNIQRFAEHGGRFGLNAEFLGGLWSTASAAPTQGVPRDQFSKYRSLLVGR